MFALIHDGLAVQIEDIAFEVHPSLEWVACDPSVQVGWTYDSALFAAPVMPVVVAPATPTLMELQTQLAVLSAQIAAFGAA